MTIKQNPRQVSKYDAELGKRIRETRKMKGVFQYSLAKELNISHQQMQKYEVGQNRIPAIRLKQIAEFLGISLDKLIDKNYKPGANLSLRKKQITDHLLAGIEKINLGIQVLEETGE